MKVLLVEDDLQTGEAIANSLTQQRFNVNWVTDGQLGLEMAESFEYDLLLLNAIVPKLNGIDLCKRLRARGSQTPILLITARTQANDCIIGLDAGADDYVIKPIEMDELMARIRAMVRRSKATVSSTTLTWENLHLDLGNGKAGAGDRPIHLTPKEFSLIELFLLNPQRIFSRSAILDRLWDEADSPGEETVSTHIKSLRHKLKAEAIPDPIETVYGLGYRLRAQETGKGQSSNRDMNRKETKPPSDKVTNVLDKHLYKVAVLTTRLQQLLTVNPITDESRTQAEMTSRKLAASLGVLGFLAAAHTASELETCMRSVSGCPPDRWQSLLDQLLVVTKQVEQLRDSKQNNQASQILAIGVEAVLLEEMQRQSRDRHLHVKMARDGTQARSAIAQSPPDLLFIDLPTRNHDDCLGMLQDFAGRFPVIVLTDSQNLSDRLTAARMGACEVLQKPQLPYQLLDAATRVLGIHRRRSRRIAIVDSDARARQEMTVYLMREGIQTAELDQPENIWTFLADTSPGLLVLDIDLPHQHGPNVNGIDLCRALRTDPRWLLLPIVFWSYCTEPDAIAQVFTAGADDYISKFTAMDETIGRLQQRLSRI